MNVGKRVDEYVKVRNELRAAEAHVKEIRGKLDRLGMDLLGVMDEDGLEQAAGHDGTAYVSETDLFQIEDREKFDKWVRRNNAFELYQARPAQRAVRERVENTRGHRLPPGLKIFKKRAINVRTK